MVHVYTVEYNSAIKKKNEILPTTTTWMDLESIVLSEISQRKTDAIWFYLCVESKNQNKWISRTKTDSQIQRTFWQLPDGRADERVGEKGGGIKKYKLEVTE